MASLESKVIIFYIELFETEETSVGIEIISNCQSYIYFSIRVAYLSWNPEVFIKYNNNLH